MNKNLIIFIPAMLFACSNDNNSPETRLSGYYKVVSITSDKPVDMNNDQTQSTDVFSEIAGPYHSTDGSNTLFYHFDQQSSFMEARPLKGSMNSSRLIAINFP